jgi:hypothetical protein
MLGFELYFVLKQRLFSVLALMAFGYGYLINSQPIGEGMSQLALNSPYRISYFMTLVSILFVFVVTLLSCSVLLKDQDHQFTEIIGSLTHRSLLLSRWLAVLLLSVLIFLCLILGMLAGLLFVETTSTQLQSISIVNFAWPWLIVAMPNTLLLSAVIMTVTTHWHNAKISYCVGLLLVAVAVTAILVIKAPISGESLLSTSGWTAFFAIVDPFAASAFFEQTQFWPPQQKNQHDFQLSGFMLINRLWVVTLALVLFGYLWRKAKGGSQLQSRRQIVAASAANTAKPTNPDNPDNPTVCQHNETMNVAQNAIGTCYWLNTFAQQVAFETRQLLTNWPIRLLLLLWLGMVLIGILMASGVFSHHEFSSKYISSASLIRQASEAFHLFSQALLVIVIAQSIWQERALKVTGLIMTTPLSTTASYLAKLISCYSISLLMLLLMLGSCLLYQLLCTDSDVNWYLYAVSGYYFLLPTLYQAVLIFFILTLMAQKTSVNQYVAITVCAAVLISLSQLLNSLGMLSPLLQLNQFPELTRNYSAIAHFAGLLEQFHLLTLYWGALALSIVLFTRRFWLAQERLVPDTSFIAMAGLGSLSAFLCMGIWLQWTLPALSNVAEDELALRANYEKSYRAFATQAGPEITHTAIIVDLYPMQRLVNIHAKNRIGNETKQPISNILVTSKLPLQNLQIRTGRLVEQRSTGLWSTYQIKLTQPMQPGENLTFDYSVQMRSEAFALNRGLVENGIYFHQGEFEPLLNYAAMLELDDVANRKQYGLVDKPSVLSGPYNQKRTMSVTLSTDSAQTAITSGELVRQWQQNGRAYFHYEMSQTIYPVVGYFSAEFKTLQWDAGGIPVTLFYHPQHHRNIAEIAKATNFTMAHMQKNFGTYAYPSLKLIEVPVYHPFGGRASAGIVALNEALFLQDYQDGAAINNVARNTIHEIAHQWFGEKLTPKVAPGEKVLTESIAKMIEATVLGQMYGEGMHASLMAFNLRRYQSGRAFTAQNEPSLLAVEGDQDYITYGKGPLVFEKLHKHLGDVIFYAVLKEFIDQHQTGINATLPELVERFAKKSKSPDHVHQLFHGQGLSDQNFSDREQGH